MARRLLVAALCFALLSGCAPITMNIEELLVPPRLNERQTRVEDALGLHVSLSSIQYKYPRAGEYRSPFVFCDLNKDGREEAVVFYSSAGTQGDIRFMAMWEQEDGSWALIDDKAGFGDQVHTVRFSNLLSTDGECMLVGWENSATGERRLDVYSHENGRLIDQYQSTYTTFNLDEYKTGLLNQIALVRQDRSDAYQLHLVGRTLDGRLADVGDVTLSKDTGEVLGLCKGFLRGSTNGIYVDERRLTDSQIATEVFEITATSLSPIVADVETEVVSELYRRTFRFDDSLLSLDLRGNGTVVIPVHQAEPLPGLTSESELDPPPLTMYLRYSYAGELEVADMAVVNADAGYLFFFPAKWVNGVTVLRRPEINEWQFYKVDPLTNLRTAELLRIRVYSVREYQDRLADNYTLLAEKGLFQYYGYRPNTTDELSLTQREMEAGFMLH